MPNIALELGKQSASLGVNSAYGEQRDVGGVQLIPVSLSWTGFGGGSDEVGNGGGGGGGWGGALRAGIPPGGGGGVGAENRPLAPRPVPLGGGGRPGPGA